MNSVQFLECILKDYKINKERACFLEKQIEKLTPETHISYIEQKMFNRGKSGKIAKFITDNSWEVSELNKVEQTAIEYKNKCNEEYKKAKIEMEAELKALQYYTSLVEDSILILERINNRYRIIIEQHYMNNVRMEDIADSMHISRSRCYELCKEALRALKRVVIGEQINSEYQYSFG